MRINLATGTLESNANLDGWIITSAQAHIDGRDDLPLHRGDRIALNGDVYRADEYLGNIA